MQRDRAEDRIQAALRFEAEGLTSRAEREYRAVLEAAPRHVIALNQLGLLLVARERFGDATRLFRRAVMADPGHLISRLNLAGALREAGDEAAAIDGYLAVLTLNPKEGGARLNLANLLRSAGRLDEARPHYQSLLASNPFDGRARWNLAALEGLAGNLEAAFDGFARHHAASPASPPHRWPRWNGEPFVGKTLLLDADQGLGDTLMFVRYAAEAKRRGGRVLLRAQPELASLLGHLEGVDAFFGRAAPAPAADLWFPLVDLPALLGVSRADGGPWARYIFADSQKVERWKPRPGRGERTTIGLAWAGNPTHPDDRNRSAPLKTLLEGLRRLDGVDLISLQIGPRAADADGTPVRRFDDAIGDVSDTAALIANLDLVVAVDTAVLHLAGAMGRPVWGLLAHAPDWRWGLGRADSPWYPTLRLFRQPARGDWASVARAVARALAEEPNPPTSEPDRRSGGPSAGR